VVCKACVKETLCVCVCVCVREREREREKGGEVESVLGCVRVCVGV